MERDENGGRLNNPVEVPFGPSISDEDALEGILKRAQLAILNPSIDSTRFVELDLSRVRPNTPPFGEKPQLSFSSNVVCVDISSPRVADLSFIDLPGIISNVSAGEDESNIELIKELVNNSIRDDSTLILLTITMMDDIQNQAAVLMARKSDPTGKRTIGVLTKPDNVPREDLDGWIEILSNRREWLRHGYFVTKQPGPGEILNLTFEAARSRETEFFRHAPWTDLGYGVRSRLGTKPLTEELSKLLIDLIVKSFLTLNE